MKFVPVLLIVFLSACAEGRWVHPMKSETEVQRDWDICKTEVLTGQEHGDKYKDMMAGSVNLSGCMRSKGYTYVEVQSGSAKGGTRQSPAP